LKEKPRRPPLKTISASCPYLRSSAFIGGQTAFLLTAANIKTGYWPQMNADKNER
jgi:hypothetical protein